MLKIETIWRELLYRAVEQHNPYFTALELARTYKLSTSLVAHALNPLRNMNMVEIQKTKSKVVDAEKLLLFWATRRNWKKDLLYTTFNRLPVMEIEAGMPSDVIPTAYSAYRFYCQDLPADYDHVYFYADGAEEIKRRFPPQLKQNPNIFILKPDNFLSRYDRIPLAHIFADLWSLPEWYSRDFSNALLIKIKEKIGL